MFLAYLISHMLFWSIVFNNINNLVSTFAVFLLVNEYLHGFLNYIAQLYHINIEHVKKKRCSVDSSHMLK